MADKGRRQAQRRQWIMVGRIVPQQAVQSVLQQKAVEQSPHLDHPEQWKTKNQTRDHQRWRHQQLHLQQLGVAVTQQLWLQAPAALLKMTPCTRN